MDPAVRDGAAPATVPRRPVAVVRLPSRDEDRHCRGFRDHHEEAGRREDRKLPRVEADSPAHPGDRATRLADAVADDVLCRPGEWRHDDPDPLHGAESPEAHSVALRRTPITIRVRTLTACQ